MFAFQCWLLLLTEESPPNEEKGMAVSIYQQIFGWTKSILWPSSFLIRATPLPYLSWGVYGGWLYTTNILLSPTYIWPKILLL